MMTRNRHNILSLAALLAITAIGAQAASVPYAESFESYSDGLDITTQSGWTGDASDAGTVVTSANVIAALTTYTNAGNSFPLPGAAHAKVLQVDETLTNDVNSAAGGVVVSDFLVFASQRDVVPADPDNAHFACYVDNTGDLVVWYSGGAGTWLTLTNSPTINTGEWTRVTVTEAFASSSLRFKVSINGASAITDGNGYDAASGGSQPGEWFDMVQTNGQYDTFRTEGDKTFYLDDLVISNRSVNYGTTAFLESTNNNGSIDNSSPMIITLLGGTFTGANGSNFVAGGEITVANDPAGLTVVAQRASDTTISVTLTGAAAAHADANDVNNLTFTFNDAAFTLGLASDVTGNTRNDLDVDFFDAPVLSYDDTSFQEVGADDGSVSETATITVGGRSFAGAVSTNYVNGGNVSVSGVPSGLTVSITKASASTATLAFSGNAAPHTSAENTSSMEVIFNDGAFNEGAASGVGGYSNGTLSVSFFDPFSLTYATSTFDELSQGQIDNTAPMVITLVNDTFASGSDFVSEGKIVVANLPANLTAVATRTGGTTLEVTLTGSAVNHTDGDDVSNLTFTFQNSAFANADATSVANYNKSDLAIDFNDVTVAINAVPYKESFEDYANGFQIVGTNGWQSGESDAGTVSTAAAILAALTNNFSVFPIDTNHTKVLCISASEITDEIKSASGSTVYSDFMAYVTERAVEPTGSTNYHAAMYVNTNGNLVVWHRNTSGPPINEWLELTAAPVTAGAWHRITVVKDYAAQTFQIHVDAEFTPVSNPTSGDTLFNMVGTADNFLSRLRVLGGSDTAISYLDDLSVDIEVPLFLSEVATTIIKFQ
jgi:hypothetical protein